MGEKAERNILITDQEGAVLLLESLIDFRSSLFDDRKRKHSKRWIYANEITQYITDQLLAKSKSNHFKLLLMNEGMLSNLVLVMNSDKFDCEFLSIRNNKLDLGKSRFLTSLRGGLKLLLNTKGVNELSMDKESYLDMADLFERCLNKISLTISPK
jgi:hypothetical protein